MLQSRRGFIRGLGLLLAAPAIVRVGSLMPVRVVASANPWALDAYAERVLGPSINELARRISLEVIYGSLTIRPEWSLVGLGEMV